MNTIKFLLILLVIIPIKIKATILNVPSQYTTIQAAINAASSGDTILVNDGTYYVNHLSVTNKSLYLHSVNGSGATILDGSNVNQILEVDNSPGQHFEIRGFTITNGRGQSSSSPWVTKFEGGTHYAFDLILKFNGQGFYTGLFWGSAIDSTTWESCIVHNNSSENNAGIRFSRVIKCLVYGNSGWNNTDPLCNCDVINCTVVYNDGGYPNPWTTGGPSQSTVRNSIIWGNGGTSQCYQCTVDYTNIQNGHGGTGNLNVYPLFTNPGSNDYSLQSTSPCIDAGDPASQYNDPDCTRNDMGALYFNQNACPTTSAGLQIDDDNVFINGDSSNGIILKDDNGLCWLLSIDTAGNTTTTQVVCP